MTLLHSLPLLLHHKWKRKVLNRPYKTDSQTVWVHVIQDALSLLVNGTVFNGNGQNPVLALSAIYGQPAIDPTYDQLSSLAEKATAYPVILITQDNTKGPLVEGHAYTVENIVQVDGGAGVTMRNLWVD